jgi:hypothetical protein
MTLIALTVVGYLTVIGYLIGASLAAASKLFQDHMLSNSQFEKTELGEKLLPAINSNVAAFIQEAAGWKSKTLANSVKTFCQNATALCFLDRREGTCDKPTRAVFF